MLFFENFQNIRSNLAAVCGIVVMLGFFYTLSYIILFEKVGVVVLALYFQGKNCSTRVSVREKVLLPLLTPELCFISSGILSLFVTVKFFFRCLLCDWGKMMYVFVGKFSVVNSVILRTLYL